MYIFPIYLFTQLSTHLYLSIYPFIYLQIAPFNLPISLFIYLSIYLDLSIYLSAGKNDFPELTEVWNHFDAVDECPGRVITLATNCLIKSIFREDLKKSNNFEKIVLKE